MKRQVLTMLLLFSLISSGCTTNETATTPTEQKATATIINSQDQEIGTAHFTESTDGVKVEIQVSELPPGPHALHIHETGKCSTPDFQSADGHFNPEQKAHGKENPQGSHAGDLENIIASANGEVQNTQIIQHVTLKKGEKNSLFQEGGTSIVIHEKADDYRSDPAGEAGKRIACGVIK